MAATPTIGMTAIPASHVLGGKLDSIPFSAYHVAVILVLGLVALVDGYDGSMTGTLLVLAKQPLHITPGGFRVLAVAAALAACVGGFVAAVFSDHWSRRTVLVLGVASINFFTLLIPLVQSGEQLIILRLLTGLAGGFAASAAFPIAAELMPAQHRRTYGAIYEMMLACSFTLVLLVGFLLAGNPNGFRLMALPALLGLFAAPVLVYLLIPESPRWYLRRGNPEAAVAVVNRIIGRLRQSRGAADGYSAWGKTRAGRRTAAAVRGPVSPGSAALDRSRHSKSRLRASLLLYNLRSAAEGSDRSRRRRRLEPWAELTGVPGEHSRQGLYRVPHGGDRAAVDDHLLPRRIAPRTSADGGSAFHGALRDRRVRRRSADHRVHRAVDLHGRAGLPLRAVPDGTPRARAIFWQVVRTFRRRRLAPFLLEPYTGSPAIFFGTLAVVASIGAFVPVLFGKETVGQLETVTEGVPAPV